MGNFASQAPISNGQKQLSNVQEANEEIALQVGVGGVRLGETLTYAQGIAIGGQRTVQVALGL
jgi:hypothetical protein